MDIHIFNNISNNQKYTIRQSTVRSTGCIIYDVYTSEKEFIQYFKLPHLDKIILSHTNAKTPQQLVNIFNYFLSDPTKFILIQTFYTPFLYFQTDDALFTVQINDESYHYSIKVGSRYFKDCVDIIVNKIQSQHQKLAQIYSEPECWSDLTKGNTVQMIKGALQFVQTLFNVHSFEFDDNSNIECGVTNMIQKSPRKLSTPFRLGHYYLAIKGETWYEVQFSATMVDKERYTEYKKRCEIFEKPVTITVDEFFEHAKMTIKQQDYLAKYYAPQKTWRTFFSSIPQSQHCFAFYNWLPNFIDNYLLYDITQAKNSRMEIRKEPWVIHTAYKEDTDRVMERVNMIIVTDPQMYSKYDSFVAKRQNNTRTNHSNNQKTRKNRYIPLSFSNDFSVQTM